MITLPDVSWDNWSAYHDQFDLYVPLVKTIIAENPFETGTLSQPVPGTCAMIRVAAADRPYFIKLFPPFLNDDFITEKEVYQLIKDTIPSPDLLGHGTYKKWGWLAITEMAGISLDHVNSSDPELYASIGKLMHTFHQLEIPDHSLGLRHWNDVIEERHTEVMAFLTENNSPGLRKEFLEHAKRYRREKRTSVLVYADLNPEHVFIHPEQLSITGLVDFADCLVADPLYETPPVWLGLCDHNLEAYRAFLTGYGNTDHAFTDKDYLLLMMFYNRFTFNDFITPLVQHQHDIEWDHLATSFNLHRLEG